MSRTTIYPFNSPTPLPVISGQGANQFPAFSPAPKLERMYTVPEVGEYLRIGPRPVYRAIAEGKLTASWVGRSHLVSESNLAAYVKSQEQASSWHQKGPKGSVEAE